MVAIASEWYFIERKLIRSYLEIDLYARIRPGAVAKVDEGIALDSR